MTNDIPPSRRYRLYFLALTFFFIIHNFEEFWGDFRAVQVLGRDLFFALNAVLLLIPFLIFYFVLENNRRALFFGKIFAVLMIFNGLWHLALLLISGRYFGSSAGVVSGLGLIIFGWLTFKFPLPGGKPKTR